MEKIDPIVLLALGLIVCVILYALISRLLSYRRNSNRRMLAPVESEARRPSPERRREPVRQVVEFDRGWDDRGQQRLLEEQEQARLAELERERQFREEEERRWRAQEEEERHRRDFNSW